MFRIKDCGGLRFFSTHGHSPPQNQSPACQAFVTLPGLCLNSVNYLPLVISSLVTRCSAQPAQVEHYFPLFHMDTPMLTIQEISCCPAHHCVHKLVSAGSQTWRPSVVFWENRSQLSQITGDRIRCVFLETVRKQHQCSH